MKALQELLGIHFPDGVPIALIPVVAAVGVDLLDGDAHLSEANRAKLGEAFEAYKRGEL